jgi:hypothetical protein
MNYAGALTKAGEKPALVTRRHRLIELPTWITLDEVQTRPNNSSTPSAIGWLIGWTRCWAAGNNSHGDRFPTRKAWSKAAFSADLPARHEGDLTRVIADKDFLRFIENHNLKPGEAISVEERDPRRRVCVRRSNNRRRRSEPAASKPLVQAVHLLLVLLSLPAWAQATPRSELPAPRPGYMDSLTTPSSATRKLTPSFVLP